MYKATVDWNFKKKKKRKKERKRGGKGGEGIGVAK